MYMTSRWHGRSSKSLDERIGRDNSRRQPSRKMRLDFLWSGSTRATCSSRHQLGTPRHRRLGGRCTPTEHGRTAEEEKGNGKICRKSLPTNVRGDNAANNSVQGVSFTVEVSLGTLEPIRSVLTGPDSPDAC